MSRVSTSDADNNGFDNEKSEYICEARDSIAYRYEIQKQIGSGSFGQVFQCLDHKTNNTVALKILRNKKHLYKQGLVEVKILKTL